MTVTRFSGEEITRNIVVRSRVHDTEPITARRTGKSRIEPNSIVVTFIQHENGPWVAEVVRVSGPVLKSDGTHGNLSRVRVFYPFELPDAPVWVRGFVQSKLPSSAFVAEADQL